MSSTNTYKLVVTNPCREKWENMQPNALGRFCDLCNKTVVDFRHLSDDEITAYILSRKNMNTCGIFQKKQIDTIRIEVTKEVLVSEIAYWKKFLLIFMLCFSHQLFAVEFVLTDSIQTDSSISQVVDTFSEFNTDSITNPDTVLRVDRLGLDTIIIPDFPTLTLTSDIYGDISVEPVNESKIDCPEKETSTAKNTSPYNYVVYNKELHRTTKKKDTPEENKEQPNHTGLLPDTRLYLPNRRRLH